MTEKLYVGIIVFNKDKVVHGFLLIKGKVKKMKDVIKGRYPISTKIIKEEFNKNLIGKDFDERYIHP